MSLSKIRGLYQDNKKVKLIIFNHTEFLDGKSVQINPKLTRPGSIGDKFEKCFTTLLGNNLEVTHIKDNKELKAAKVVEKIHEVAERYEDYSSVIVFVSSHGDVFKSELGYNSEVILAYDKLYPKHLLWKIFSEKPQWKEKPILFFFQACRGKQGTVGVKVFSIDAESSSTEVENFEDTNVILNLFILNATQPGSVAYKLDDSSPFVDAIYDTFTDYANKTDLNSLAIKVCNKVATEFEKCSKIFSVDCSKQMPCFESTLTSSIYLSTHFEHDVESEVFYECSGTPVALFFNYSSNNNTDRIKKDTKILSTYFIDSGYTCVEKWNASFEEYLNLIKTYFNQQDRGAFYVIFNGYGEIHYFRMNRQYIKLPKLWMPVLKPPTTGVIEEKLKVFMFLGNSTKNCSAGTAAKFTTLFNKRGIKKEAVCQDDIDGQNIKNIPNTADLLLLFQNASENSFVEKLCDELKQGQHGDFVRVITAINAHLHSSNEEPILKFSTTRKLIPINVSTNQPGKYIIDDETH